MIRTEILFVGLLKQLAADCICDVGSMDGAHALLFKKACPEAMVFAFEANPYNFERIKRDHRLQAIDGRHLAASDVIGSARFYIAPVNYDDDEANRGMSSLYAGEDPGEEECDVSTMRLDHFLSETAPACQRIATLDRCRKCRMGSAGRIRGVAEKLLVLHIEVEKTPLKVGQKLYADVQHSFGSWGSSRSQAISAERAASAVILSPCESRSLMSTGLSSTRAIAPLRCFHLKVPAALAPTSATWRLRTRKAHICKIPCLDLFTCTCLR